MPQYPQTKSIAIAARHKHNVLPMVLMKDVEITPPPIPSDKTETIIVKMAKPDRKINAEGGILKLVIYLPQSPAARPLSAMIPRGRNWIKMIINRIM